MDFLVVVYYCLLKFLPFVYVSSSNCQQHYVFFSLLYAWQLLGVNDCFLAFSQPTFGFQLEFHGFRNFAITKFFINCYQKFMVYFNFSFCNPNYQMNLTQIVECKMGKENHTNLFVIEESIITKGVDNLFKPHLDVDFQ